MAEPRAALAARLLSRNTAAALVTLEEEGLEVQAGGGGRKVGIAMSTALSTIRWQADVYLERARAELPQGEPLWFIESALNHIRDTALAHEDDVADGDPH